MQRILVIDDDPTVTSVLKRGLVGGGRARHAEDVLARPERLVKSACSMKNVSAPVRAGARGGRDGAARRQHLPGCFYVACDVLGSEAWIRLRS